MDDRRKSMEVTENTAVNYKGQGDVESHNRPHRKGHGI